MSIVYLNGEFLPLEKATVSVEDRGFLFADGVYEVVRYYRGRPFQLEAHIQRLQRSAQGACLPLPKAVAELPAIIARLLTENNLQDTNIYIECTRGSAHPRTHAFPAEPHPTLLVMPQSIHALPSGARTQGVSTITVPDLRWQRCDVKSIMLLPNVMAKTQAREQRAFEAILVRDGVVTEGASTNIFAVFDGVLATHPANHHILGGITRQVVLQLATDLGLVVREEPFTVDKMYRAQEVFLTSTTSEILPITQIDGRQIGNGSPGPVTMHLFQAFRKVVEKEG
ncbi:MAG: D-amino-acid transaminase [Anaerolineae bacterium]